MDAMTMLHADPTATRPAGRERRQSQGGADDGQEVRFEVPEDVERSDAGLAQIRPEPVAAAPDRAPAQAASAGDRMWLAQQRLQSNAAGLDMDGPDQPLAQGPERVPRPPRHGRPAQDVPQMTDPARTQAPAESTRQQPAPSRSDADASKAPVRQAPAPPSEQPAPTRTQTQPATVNESGAEDMTRAVEALARAEAVRGSRARQVAQRATGHERAHAGNDARATAAKESSGASVQTAAAEAASRAGEARDTDQTRRQTRTRTQLATARGEGPAVIAGAIPTAAVGAAAPAAGAQETLEATAPTAEPRISVDGGPGGDDAVIRLNDGEAGPLEVRVRRDGQDLSVRVRAEDLGLRQQMLESLPEIRRELAKASLVEGRIDVSEQDVRAEVGAHGQQAAGDGEAGAGDEAAAASGDGAAAPPGAIPDTSTTAQSAHAGRLRVIA